MTGFPNGRIDTGFEGPLSFDNKNVKTMMHLDG
jgi:hypothetical protein